MKADGSKAVIEENKSDASSSETYPLIKTMMMVMLMIIMLVTILIHYKHITLSLI